MSDPQGENLRALENLMTEFFLPSTTNERKRHIEELLNSFSQQKDCWQLCLVFMQKTENHYVMMYCLSVLENIINKKWHGLETDGKRVIRDFIIQYLVESYTKLPVYIINKLAKLNVDIARHDWPHFYHDFLTSILQLMDGADTALLGVLLLQTTSEEMVNPREDLSISRKQELQDLLLETMPSILTVLSGILDKILEKHKLLPPTQTPPPSPSGSSAISNSNKEQNFSKLFQSPAYKVTSRASLLPFDNASVLLSSQVLKCIMQLFTWIPLSNMITADLLNSIFSFAAFGCEARQSIAPDGQGQSLGMLAMCCINELLNKNCVPLHFESYLLQLFQQTFYLLKKLATDDRNFPLNMLDSDFLDKFTEFVRLFVSNHLRRFEANPQFPVMEFLSLLYHYTFKQSTADEFFACLEIWQVFVDYVNTKSQNRTSNDRIVSRYYDGIMSLVKELIKKVQFRHNREQLELLDSEDVDDDGLTELQRFISHCYNTLVMIAELIPDDILTLVENLQHELVSFYLQVPEFLSKHEQLSADYIHEIHCNLKDLCAALQLTARMVDFCTGSVFDDRFTQTDKLVKQLIELALFNEKMRLYQTSQQAPANKLTDVFVEVYAQTLSSLKAYCYWIAQYYVESFHKPGVKEKCTDTIMTLVNCVTTTIDNEVPYKILEWSVDTLSTIMTIVRPMYLYSVPCIHQLYTKVSNGFSTVLPPKVSAVLCKALSSYLILRWPALPDSEQKWETRGENHSQLMNSIHSQFLLLKNVADLTSTSQTAQEARRVVTSTLTSLTSLISCINEEPKRTKEIMCKSVTEYIQLSLQFFSVYISESVVLEKILEFFLALLHCLRVQMGIAFTERTIQTCMDLFTKERLTEIIKQENQTAYKIIESFLKMLDIIVQDSSSSFRRLLPQIISICMEHVYPVVAPKPNPEIKLPLFELLYEILNSNWKFFFKSSVKVTFGGVNPSEPLDNKVQFVSILHAFGESFLQPDISIFKHNLEAMEKLNQKWKLYHKTIFLEEMMSQFLNVLLQTLVIRSHDLLQEEIITAVYNMASVDFSMFYNSFITGFLKQVTSIDFYQKETLKGNLSPEDKDLPTFTSNVMRMVNDLRYYTIVNASLPPGTIDLSQTEPEPISEY